MAIKTQGTDLYFIDPEDQSVVNVGCVTSISGISSAVDQIETTCLNGNARTYEAGLATPGDATFSIYFDPQNPVHLRLLELKNEGVTLDWAIGWSDGPSTAVPTADSAGEFTFPTTRSFLSFEGYISDLPFTFEINSVVTSEISLQVSGEIVLTPKAV